LFSFEMRSAGVRGVLIYCADYNCSHYITAMADRWADDVRLSDIEPRFVGSARGKRRCATGFPLGQKTAPTKGF
jgi:hypothetical protein